jgi:hypothetical protein
MAKRKRTNNDLQNITHNTKDTVTYQSYGTPIFLETLTSSKESSEMAPVS